MFSTNTIQPQIFVAVSQLSSILNHARSSAQSIVTSHRHHGNKLHHRNVNAPSTLVQDALPDLPDPQRLVEGLDLVNLPTQMTAEAWSPYLALSEYGSQGRGKHTDSLWSQSHTSARSFFENKTGFPESDLYRGSFDGRFLDHFSKHLFQQLSKSSSLNTGHQQRRGFITDRKTEKMGIGRNTTSNSVLEDLKKSVYSRVFTDKSKKGSSKFKHFINQQDHPPEFQEKLKVAFAEGYTASEKKDSDPKHSFMTKILKTFIYVALFWLAIQVFQVFSAMGGGTGVRGLGVLNREQFEVNPEEVHVTFDDVKGVDEAKQELQDIVEYLRDPEKFTSLGAKLPKGVLLVGPPGIGKTLLARAVAGEAGVPFFHASGSEFDEIFVGTGAKRVRQLFSAAKVRSPCVIFIDEIDSVGAKRTSSQIHPYANQTINQLLSEMDGFTQNEGVIVLGATNRRDNLDKAILRPGRFDVEVRVFSPDLKGRTEILEYYLSKVKRDTEIDVEKLARGTTGFTGADLENVVNQAALKAAMDGAATVTMVHMEFARDKVLMGPAKKNKIPDEQTNLLTAYHEAGHTIVAYFTKDATPLHKVTIIPRGMALGHTSFLADKEVFNKTKAELLAEMDVCMGGRVAEEIVYGIEKVTTGASSDFQQATTIAVAMVKRFGMSEKVGVRVFDDSDPFDSGLSMLKVNELSPAVQELVDNEIKKILQESYDRAKNLIKTHLTEHRALAQCLMKHETLNKEEITGVIEGRGLKKITSV
ncbi:hypothetical protein ScPMuIL_011964 [Solemya velum]